MTLKHKLNKLEARTPRPAPPEPPLTPEEEAAASARLYELAMHIAGDEDLLAYFLSVVNDGPLATADAATLLGLEKGPTTAVDTIWLWLMLHYTGRVIALTDYPFDYQAQRYLGFRDCIADALQRVATDVDYAIYLSIVDNGARALMEWAGRKADYDTWRNPNWHSRGWLGGGGFRYETNYGELAKRARTKSKPWPRVV